MGTDDNDLDFLDGLTDSEDETEIQEVPVQEQKNDDLNHAEIDFEIKMWEMIRLFFNDGSCKNEIIEYLGFNRVELMQQQQAMDDEKSNDNTLTVDTAAPSEEVAQVQPIHSHHHHLDEESDDDLGFFDQLGNDS